MGKATKMLINVSDMLKNPFAQIVRQKYFQIKTVIFVVCLNYCLRTCLVSASPTIQQEQELLLLEALSKRQPSYYGTSNSLMDILGQSMFAFDRSIILVHSKFVINIGILHFRKLKVSALHEIM